MTTATRPEPWYRPVANKSISWDDSAVVSKLKTFNAKADRFLTAATAYHATKATKYARANAPWTDQTTNARNGLFARAERDVPSYRIIVGHSVPYGAWLEVRWSGRYQIIRPTIDHTGPELMQTVSTMFSKL